MTKKDQKDDSSEIEELQKQLEAEKSKAMRALADLENLRRREAENKASWVSGGIAHFLKVLLPSFLELQLGKSHTTDEEIKKVIDKFFGELEKAGLQKIDPKSGEPIDPDLHEILLTEEGKKGTVVRVLEIGWKFQNIIISPAKISANQN